MADLKITQPDSVVLKIDCDRSLAKELNSYFTFTVPNFQYTPAFKKRLWDGKIRLFNLYTQTIFAGLAGQLVKFAKDRGYTWEESLAPYDIPSPEAVKGFIDALPITAGGKEIRPYDYQVEAVQHALNRSRALLVSPTGSGKSLMIYLLTRWILDQNPTGKVLIIVPTTSLVAQMLADFREYSKRDSWRADRNIHTIMSGKDKHTSKRIVISTWQSIYNQPYDYFDDFVGVFGDECLHPNTRITMADGSEKEIKDIKSGELVKTFNETTKSIEIKPVIEVHKNISLHEEMYEIELDNGRTIKITGNHKVLLKSGKWERADNLKEGDIINTFE